MTKEAFRSNGHDVRQMIDVICSVKNGGLQFAATINSVLNQSCFEFRFVIIDDGSDDGVTGEIADTAASYDNRIVVFHNAVSQGLTANLVKHVEKSNAVYIARIDAGDTWLPGKLARQLKVMQDNQNIVVLGTQCVYVSPDGESLGSSRFAEADNAIRANMLSENGVFSHSTIMFRNIINYRYEFRYSQDYDLYLRASEIGHLFCLSEQLINCSIDTTGLTVKNKYLQRKYQTLALRSHISRTRSGEDIPLVVSDHALERACWSLAMRHYYRYITSRTRRQPPIFWIIHLGLAMLLFPPLFGDYFRRLFFYSRKV